LAAAAPINTTAEAGYVTFLNATSETLTTTFTVPALTCTATNAGIAPGAFIFDGPTSAEKLDGAAVIDQCVSGKAQANAATVIAGATNNDTTHAVAAGDKIQVTVTVGTGGTSVKVQDLTTGRTFTDTASGTDTAPDAELPGVDAVISGSTLTQLPVPTFSGASFTSTMVGGTAIGTASPTAVQWVKGCAILLRPGAISSGTNFRVSKPTIDITSLSPSSGVTGSTDTINGTGFNTGSTVAFSGVASTTVTHVSSTQLKATVPANAKTGPVTVTNTTTPIGSITSACNFRVTPTITSFTPGSGITGSTFTINGTGFEAVTTVKVGSLSAPHTIVSASQISAKVPSGATTATISVTSAGGTATSATSYTVTLSVTGFSPSSGVPTTSVTITGVGFNSSSKAKFHGTAAVTTFVSSTQLKAVVPSGATSGPITVTNTLAPVGTVASRTSFTVT
jgi:hypothetical protein